MDRNEVIPVERILLGRIFVPRMIRIVFRYQPVIGTADLIVRGYILCQLNRVILVRPVSGFAVIVYIFRTLVLDDQCSEVVIIRSVFAGINKDAAA